MGVRNRIDLLLLALAWAVVAAGIALNSAQRTFPGTGAEADFVGPFASDADRLVAHEPMRLDYHPPGYPMALVLAESLAGDRFRGALWVSGLSALIVVCAGSLVFRRMVSPLAAWGAVAACACSTAFLGNASLATSDMPFAALVTLTLALLVAAMRSGRLALWALAGAAAAAASLFRSNGIACALVVLAPVLAPHAATPRRRCIAAALGGFVAPWLVWIAWATATGSPALPVSNYVSLAVAGYGSKGTAEEFLAIRGDFEGIADVLTYDPLRFARTVAGRLLRLPWNLLTSLGWSVISLLAVPGAFVLLWRHRSRPLAAYLAVVAANLGVMGLHPYFDRFNVAFLPLLGAMAALAFAVAIRGIHTHAARVAVVLSASASLAVVGWSGHVVAMSHVETPMQDELAEAVPALRTHVESGALLFARKPFLGFGEDVERRYLPDVTTVGELRRVIEAQRRRSSRPAYLFVGRAERERRPELIADLQACEPVAWLEPVARGSATRWTLYRVLAPHAAEPASRAP